MFCFLYFLQKICVADGVKYIVSPYESDAQIAHILSIGHANFAITEDSDMLVYGCKKVWYSLIDFSNFIINHSNIQ